MQGPRRRIRAPCSPVHLRASVTGRTILTSLGQFLLNILTAGLKGIRNYERKILT